MTRSAQMGSLVGVIPAHTHAALLRYIDHGSRLGGFCTAVLSNDLAGAVQRADTENIVALPLIVGWLREHAPAVAWGSPARVEAWIARRGQQADAAAQGPAVRP